MAERGNKMSNIIISPVTRISGFLEIDVTIENNMVIDAKSVGLFFRGFEKMMNGRNPFDAVYFTERICGICSTAHSLTSTLALENALGIIPSEQGRYLRDIIHGCEFLQNHIRHFYQFKVPDFVKMPEEFTFFDTSNYDYRIPIEKNDLIAKHYFESLELSRDAHQILALFGGKAPHNHGIFLGGATSIATADKIIKFKSILLEISQFIEEKMLPDVYTISEYYSDYFLMGGGYGNLLSYGCFNDYKDLGTLYLGPLVYRNREISILHPENITEEIDYSWYFDQMDSYRPFETVPMDDMNKNAAYSWVKAAKYQGISYEGGPLARQWLSGEYRHGISAMDRTIARVLETKKIAEILNVLIDNLIPGILTQTEYEIPVQALGAGLVDTTRGPLGHWLKIDDSVISFYQIITPSVWNLSSRGNDGRRGTVEQALIGTYIEDEENPVALGRIVRTFDPCVSCATHVHYSNKKSKVIQVVP